MGASSSLAVTCPFPKWQLDELEAPFHRMDGNGEFPQSPTSYPQYIAPNVTFSEPPQSDVPTRNARIVEDDLYEDDDDMTEQDMETIKLLAISEVKQLVLQGGEFGLKEGNSFLPLKFGLRLECKEQYTGSNISSQTTEKNKLRGTDLISALTVVKSAKQQIEISHDLSQFKLFPEVPEGISCRFLVEDQSFRTAGTCVVNVRTEKYLIIVLQDATINLFMRHTTTTTSANSLRTAESTI